MDRNQARKLHPELFNNALECLLAFCTAEKPRLQRAAEAYVFRAIALLKIAGENMDSSRIETVKDFIRELVDGDDQQTTEIISANDWAQTTRVVLLYAAKKYKRNQILGKQLSDYYQDAVVQLLDRSRHLPHYRGVKLNSFLCETVRSIIDHEIEKAAGQPVVVRIVRGKSNLAAGEFSERLLPSARP